MSVKSLNTLIRLQKQRVDELRRSIAQLEAQKQKLIDQSKKLEEELQEEIQLAATQPAMGGFFGDFADRIRKKREELAVAAAQIERSIQQVMETLRDAFGELKKYEIAKEQRVQREKEKRARLENAQLDEVAISQYARREKEPDEG